MKQNFRVLVSYSVMEMKNLNHEQASNAFNTHKLKDGEKVTLYDGEKVLKSKSGKML